MSHQKIWSRMRSSESWVHLPCGIWLGSTPTQDSIVPKELVYFGNPDPKHVSRNVFLVDFYDCIPCGGRCPSRHASYYGGGFNDFFEFSAKYTWGNCWIQFDEQHIFLKLGWEKTTSMGFEYGDWWFSKKSNFITTGFSAHPHGKKHPYFTWFFHVDQRFPQKFRCDARIIYIYTYTYTFSRFHIYI